jgi:16S rRNA processing protein RimM
MNTGAASPEDLVEVGFLRGAYGLQGWVHVQPHSGDADVLRGARQWWLRRPKPAAAGSVGNEAATLLEITGVRAQGAALVAKWQGCDDPESAEALKGCGIAVSRARFPQLPPGQYYWVDLVGSQVINRAGLPLGVVSGLRSNGAHDLLEVARAVAHAAPGGEGAAPAGVLLIPMVPAYVEDVDLAARCIRVDWEADWS